MTKNTGYHSSDVNSPNPQALPLINTHPCLIWRSAFGFLPAFVINMLFSVFPYGRPHTKQGLCGKKDPKIDKERVLNYIDI